MKKWICLLSVILLLGACGKSEPAAQIAKPQRDALDKAKTVDDTVQKAADKTRENIDASEAN